jgi:hypothetical protein
MATPSIQSLSFDVQSQPPTRTKDTPYRRKKSATKSLALRAIQRDGFPRPDAKGYTRIPHAFDAIVAEESRAVIRVVYEVLRQTEGYIGDGPDGRREWVALSFRHFARKGHMSKDMAKQTLAYTVTAGYLLRRPGKRHSWEYALHWSESDFVPS